MSYERITSDRLTQLGRLADFDFFGELDAEIRACWAALATERAARERAEADAASSCPCQYVETVAPCEPSCSCANPIMSGGCSRCCRYGSKEQRLAMAEAIVRRERAEAAIRKTMWEAATGAADTGGCETAYVESLLRWRAELLGRAERAEAESARLEQRICDFQAAAMIDVGGQGGPCLVEPRHVEQYAVEMLARLEAAERVCAMLDELRTLRESANKSPTGAAPPTADEIASLFAANPDALPRPRHEEDAATLARLEAAEAALAYAIDGIPDNSPLAKLLAAWRAANARSDGAET